MDNLNYSTSDKIADKLTLVASFLAVSLTTFEIWQSITANLSAPIFRPLYLSWVLALVFLVYPLVKPSKSNTLYILARAVDIALIAAVCWAANRLLHFDYDDISFLLDGLQPADQLAGIVIIAALLEATRRTVGLTMLLIAALFLSYALFGDILPAGFSSKGFSLEEIIRFHIFSTNGVFGAPLAIAAGVVFILFSLVPSYKSQELGSSLLIALLR